MSQRPLPENFACAQQEGLHALFDDAVFDEPKIVAATGGAGCGKTHGCLTYQGRVHARHAARMAERRVITLADARDRFVQEGYRGAEDVKWLERAWRETVCRERVSEDELTALMQRRREALPRLQQLSRNVSEPPCPRVVYVKPSQTTSEAAMMAILAEAISETPQAWRSAYYVRHVVLEHLQRPGTKWLIIVDEAQRLKLAPLILLREVHDDAGAALALVGTPDLETNLHRRGAESLCSRVRIHYRMDALTFEQLRKLLAGWEAKLVRRIFGYTGGVFRRIESLVQLAEQIREVNDEPRITLEILDAAAANIPDLLAPADVRSEAVEAAATRADLARPGKAAAGAPAPETRQEKQATA